MTGHLKHHDAKAFRKQLIRWTLGIAILMTTILVVSTLFTQYEPAGTESVRVFSRGGELRIEHDEAIMLLVSLVVIIEIITSYTFIRLIQYRGLLLASFFMFVLGAVLTVAEGFVLKGVLNYLEHLSLLASAVLLAAWCGRVFRGRKQEGA